jgi:hypothetical protein
MVGLALLGLGVGDDDPSVEGVVEGVDDARGAEPPSPEHAPTANAAATAAARYRSRFMPT